MAQGRFRGYLSSLPASERRTLPAISFASSATNENIDGLANEFKAKLKLQLELKDLRTSGSKWTVPMFCRYLVTPPALNISYDLQLPRSPKLGEIGKNITDAYKQHAEIFEDHDVELIPSQLCQQSYGQQTARVFAIDFFTPILRRNQLILRTDQELYISRRGIRQKLPNSQANYVIFTRDRNPLGCFEVKDKGTLIKKSIVQGMLQLISLREKAPNTLFNIITDGFQFIFMTLDSNGTFHLEVTDKGKCRTHKIERWEDVEDIAAKVDALLIQITEELI